MSNLATIQPKQLSAGDIRANANLMQEVMESVMKQNTHYGTIPGCKQPTLYKAGSEVILSTFRIAVDPVIEDMSTEDEIRYRVKAVGVHQVSGIVVGTGVGECSSNEEKYKWRGAVCDAEYQNTPANRKRVKYYRNGGTADQVRTNPADLANTVLKMAKKRAQIDLTLTATAASDIFTQDIEDLPEGYAPSDQPAAEPAELPAMPADKFSDIINKQQKFIADGQTTPEKIINKLSTKYTLTEEQKAAISDLA